MKTKSTQVFIDPKVNIHYGSFYLQGLMDKFGKENVEFDRSNFGKLNDNQMCMNFVVSSNNVERRYTIDFNDFSTVKAQEYEWLMCMGM